MLSCSLMLCWEKRIQSSKGKDCCTVQHLSVICLIPSSYYLQLYKGEKKKRYFYF